MYTLYTEPEFVNLLTCPGVDSQPFGPECQPSLMTYRPARLHAGWRNRFMGSSNVYKFGLRSMIKEWRGLQTVTLMLWTVDNQLLCCILSINNIFNAITLAPVLCLVSLHSTYSSMITAPKCALPLFVVFNNFKI